MEEKKSEKEKKPIFKKWWFWLIIVIVVIAIGSAGSDNTVGDSNTTEKETIQSGKKEEKVEVKEFYGLNEEAELEGANITVTKVEKSAGERFNEPKAGQEFVAVTVNIKNTSNRNISYNPYDYKLQDSNGNIVTQAFGSVDRDTRLSSGELAPGGTKTGSITFEVPIDDKDLTLIYEGNFWRGKQLKFKLQ